MTSAITYLILSIGWCLRALSGWTMVITILTDLSVSFGLTVRHGGVEFSHIWLCMFPLWSFPDISQLTEGILWTSYHM